MHRLISAPTRIEAAGNPPKTIEEFIGRVNSHTGEVSIARMAHRNDCLRALPDRRIMTLS